MTVRKRLESASSTYRSPASTCKNHSRAISAKNMVMTTTDRNVRRSAGDDEDSLAIKHSQAAEVRTQKKGNSPRVHDRVAER